MRHAETRYEPKADKHDASKIPGNRVLANFGSAAHLTEVGVEIIEEGGPPLNPRKIILMGDANPRDELSNALEGT
jgi:hypothetical protein